MAAAKEAWQLALDKAMDDVSLSLDAIELRAQAAYDFALAGGKGGKGGAASVEEGTPRAEKGAEKRTQAGTQGAQSDNGTGIGGADDGRGAPGVGAAREEEAARSCSSSKIKTRRILLNSVAQH